MTSSLTPMRGHTRILAAGLIGTSVEFQDFYIYATAVALVDRLQSRRHLRRHARADRSASLAAEGGLG